MFCFRCFVSVRIQRLFDCCCCYWNNFIFINKEPQSKSVCVHSSCFVAKLAAFRYGKGNSSRKSPIEFAVGQPTTTTSSCCCCCWPNKAATGSHLCSPITGQLGLRLCELHARISRLLISWFWPQIRLEKPSCVRFGQQIKKWTRNEFELIIILVDLVVVVI